MSILPTLLAIAATPGDPDARDAAHALRFWVEGRCMTGDDRWRREVEIEMTLSDSLTTRAGIRDIADNRPSKEERDSFIHSIADLLANSKTDKRNVAYILKQSFVVLGIQDRITDYLLSNWAEDTQVSTRLLDCIWEQENRTRLVPVLNEMAKSTDPALSDYARQILEVQSQL